MSILAQMGKDGKKAAREMAKLSSGAKDGALIKMAAALEKAESEILAANAVDLENAREKGISGALLDRLSLNGQRISSMAEGLRQVAALPDPVGEVISAWRRPNGLMIEERRVPLGLIAIIYEARPNVTADAAALCLKAGNAVILRGGSEAINSNLEIARVLNSAGAEAGLPDGAVGLLADTSRAAATELMRLHEYVDVLIPRGGAGLIKSVVENSSVPIIETGLGNCHVFISKSADIAMALRILINSKTQRPGVCNAAESLLVDEAIAGKFLPLAAAELAARGVEIRGCEKSRALVSAILPATEEDWGREYLGDIISVKIVPGLSEAIEHINTYGTGHSDAIVTESYEDSQRFLDEVDSAAVFVNASTRFTDGGEFGFGAEIGISTQKLHARGPMGLKQLTTIKYAVRGGGQIR